MSLSLINKFSSPDAASRFLHLVIDDLCGKSVSYPSASPAEKSALHGLVSSYKRYFTQSVGVGVKKEKLVEVLKAGAVNDALVDAIAECALARTDAIRATLLSQASTMGHTYLSDFDWRVHLSVSNDKVSAVREPLLLLQLTLKHHNTPSSPSATSSSFLSEDVTVELTKADLAKLLASLEGLQQAVQDLRS